ncbi:MAG: hypothetical protein ACRDYC_06390 [Acidimicrobiales bacterium]
MGLPQVGRRDTARRTGRRAAGVLLLAGAAALGAGCGSSSTPNSSATTTQTTTAHSTTPTSSSPTTANGSSQLSTIESQVNGGANLTYKAVYTASTSGQTQTITIEQAPPKSVFSVGSSEVIGTGTTTYYCSTGSGASCISSSGANPLASIENLISPATVIAALNAAQAESAAKAAGYSLTYSSGTYAGQTSTCANVSGPGGSGKYCVAGDGLLTYVGSGTNTFELTSYSTTAPASDFSLPSGATIQTLPPGITIP